MIIKHKSSFLAITSAILLVVLFVQGMVMARDASQPTEAIDTNPQVEKITTTAANSEPVPQDVALAKLQPALREIAQSYTPALPERNVRASAQEPVMVQVMLNLAESEREVDLSAYFVDGKYHARPVMKFGDQNKRLVAGLVEPSALVKLASLGQVQFVMQNVLEQNAYPDNYPIEEALQVEEKDQEDWAVLRQQADTIRANALSGNVSRAMVESRLDNRTPEDWYEVDVEGPHKAEAAWARGYQGEGVTVAVLDDGIDQAHPDLIGTQKIYSSTVASEYNGWPMVYSPISALLYYYQDDLGIPYIANGYPGAHYVDTSTTPELTACGSGLACFNYTPLIDYGVLNPFAPADGYTYVIESDWTQSGVVHVGTHPDNDLRDYVLGEKPAVIVIDPNVAGVYDTVLVDLDADYDFRDEMWLTRADVNDLGTVNDMIAYRDVNGDGLPDISGGMVYFIGDGQHTIPGTDWTWGADCSGGFMCPGNGDLVAISGGTFDRAYSHGTQCASNIVGQGVTQDPADGADDSFLPKFRDLSTADNQPDGGAVRGMAPEAKVVNISDIYYDHVPSTVEGYLFAAVGYDGIDQTGFSLLTGTIGNVDTDAIQITSNSYGSSDTDNDGWEYRGQVVSQVQRWWGPNLQFLFSTGNGASAYGTVAPPNPITGIGVGASTEFGSTGWDSITETSQIMNNDVTPFSNRGVGARGNNGVDVVAGGAFAAGAQELNYYSPSTWGAPNGNLSWASWGGTSRSAPVASGVLALIYQAYYEANGWWPTYEEAQALLMSTSTDINYDTFTQGAGSVNADRGTAVAGGHYGLYITGEGPMEPYPGAFGLLYEGLAPTWEPGDLRDTDYPGSAHVVYPGETHAKTFTVHNPGTQPITAEIDDAEMMLLNSVEFDFTITEEMRAAETADNFYKAFHYFIPITATESADSAWQNIEVPAGTDLMVVRQTFPFDQFDVDGDYSWDNRVYLMVYNWMDVDDDGIVWDDKDGNGVVNFVNGNTVTLIDGGVELDWDNPATELDRWEFGRFSYHRPTGNRNEMWVQSPLERMHDGLFIGLRHLPSGYDGPTDLHYRVDFYQREDTGWIDLSDSSITVAAGASETFTATIDVPADIPAGMYQAHIQVSDPGATIGADEYAPDTAVIPVVMNVGADFADGMQLGGMDQYMYDEDRPYNNAAVRGVFDWGWRPESGDWRFFMFDVDNYDTPIMVEGFEGAFPPANWTVTETIGSCSWYADDAAESDPEGNRTGSTGNFADADSDECSAGMDTQMWTPSLDLSAAEYPYLRFNYEFQSWLDEDDAYVKVSTDGGNTWDTVFHIDGYDVPGPEVAEIDLSDYAGEADVIINFHYTAPAPAWAWWWQVDEVIVGEYNYGPGTQFLIKDVWEGPAPSTDIDTILLGPAPSELGQGWYDFPEPDFYGPYVLDTIGKSPNTNVGDGIWLFNTTSGGPEEWISGPINDGLHEILQHNVMFEGDQIDVVFTKTLGTLAIQPTQFVEDVYEDQGVVGTVSFEASLATNGVVAQAVGPFGPEFITNEPVDFVSSNTIEWTDAFVTDGALYFDLLTSSPDISDIDLYVFYCGPTGASCSQRGASTTGTANESIHVEQPEDGVWVVGINNWSGPAGHFNLTRVVAQGDGFDISGLPSGSIAAGEEVTFTVTYSEEMMAGVSYLGELAVGIPEAPNLQIIPIQLDRAQAIEKTVAETVAFPGDEVHYTITLNNVMDPTSVEVTDVMPDGLTLVSASAGTISGDTWSYDGTLTGTMTVDLTAELTGTFTPGMAITNTATITAPALFDGTRSSSATFHVGTAAEFATSYKMATTEAEPGEIVEYSIHVINSGDELASVTVTDTIPANTTFVALDDAPPAQDFVYNMADNQVEWMGNVGPGDEMILTFWVEVNAGAPRGDSVANTAYISWDGHMIEVSASTDVPMIHVFLPVIRK